jgi:hypothetical protein
LERFWRKTPLGPLGVNNGRKNFKVKDYFVWNNARCIDSVTITSTHDQRIGHPTCNFEYNHGVSFAVQTCEKG